MGQGIYEKLGIKTYINAYDSMTILGGSIMPLEVRQAMVEAGEHYVDMHELHRKVGERIAGLLGVEAAYVSCGASAGLVVATAACIAGKDPAKIVKLPFTEGMKNEVVIQRGQRTGFDQAIRQVGVKLVEIGFPGETLPWELEAAINERTAAVAFIQGLDPNPIPLEEVCEIAHRRGVPVIVDAAAEVPPVSNLQDFLNNGADLVVFSGGKGLWGPQSTGLVLGRKDLIEACAANACPNFSIGRPMKVGKEEIIGLLTAIELFLQRDHDQQLKDWCAQVEYLEKELAGIEGISVHHWYAPVSAVVIPRAMIELDEEALGFTQDDLIRQLREGEPGIAVRPHRGAISVNPHHLKPGEIGIVAARLREILTR